MRVHSGRVCVSHSVSLPVLCGNTVSTHARIAAILCAVSTGLIMRVSQLLLHNNQPGHQEAQLAGVGQAYDRELPQLRATVARLEAELRVEQQKLVAAEQKMVAAEQRMVAAELHHREAEVIEAALDGCTRTDRQTDRQTD